MNKAYLLTLLVAGILAACGGGVEEDELSATTSKSSATPTPVGSASLNSRIITSS